MPRHHRPSITCPRCGWTSYSADDIASGWCFRCQAVTSTPSDTAEDDQPELGAEDGYPYRCLTCRAPLRDDPLGAHKIDPAGNAFCPRVDSGGPLGRRVPRTLHTPGVPGF